MPVLQIRLHAVAALLVAVIVCIGNGELLENSELRLDQIEPGGLSRRPDGMNVEFPQEREESWVIMHQSEVVQNHEQLAARIALAEAAEDVADLLDAPA